MNERQKVGSRKESANDRMWVAYAAAHQDDQPRDIAATVPARSKPARSKDAIPLLAGLNGMLDKPVEDGWRELDHAWG